MIDFEIKKKKVKVKKIALLHNIIELFFNFKVLMFMGIQSKVWAKFGRRRLIIIRRRK